MARSGRTTLYPIEPPQSGCNEDPSFLGSRLLCLRRFLVYQQMLHATAASVRCSQYCPGVEGGFTRRNLLGRIAPAGIIAVFSVTDPIPVRSRIATVAVIAIFDARKDEAQGLVVVETSLHGHAGRVQRWIGRVGELAVVAVQVAVLLVSPPTNTQNKVQKE